MTENSVASISKEEVREFYQEFLEALKSGDTTSLERIYADDYLLVRPNGDTLSKKEIIADLRHHSMFNYSHKSMTTSRVGCEQQISRLPLAGLSSGSGL
jgi:ketosteroid isomerase-like protein